MQIQRQNAKLGEKRGTRGRAAEGPKANRLEQLRNSKKNKTLKKMKK